MAIARRDPALVRVLPRDFAYALDLWVVMHEDLRTSQRMRLVYDALAKGLAAYAARP